MAAYRMTKFLYGYINETTGEMLRVGKTRYDSWRIQYRRRFGVLPRNIGATHRTKVVAMRELMAIRHNSSAQLDRMSTPVS